MLIQNISKLEKINIMAQNSIYFTKNNEGKKIVKEFVEFGKKCFYDHVSKNMEIIFF